MVTARATGQRVEVLSERTGTASVFARPDGTWVTDEAAAPFRMQGRDGAWHDLDDALEPTVHGFQPRHALTGLVIPDGGTTTFASLEQGGREVAWRWPTVLPKPVVVGASATFRGVAAGGAGDLVVTATRAGFRQDVVLNRRPERPVVLPTSVNLDGGRVLRSAGSGRVTVENADGKPAAVSDTPLMWDSRQNTAGDPAHPVRVATAVVNGTSPAVVLTPDAAFLTDPETKYPVTIDPTYTTYPLSDTWVMNADYTSSQSSSSELRAGTYDGGPHMARSFLKWVCQEFCVSGSA